MEREQEKFSGEWAGTTRPSNQSLDYSRVVGVCGGAHTVVSRVSLTLPFSSFLSSTVLSSPLLDPTTVRPPFLSTTIASSPLPPSVLLPPLVLSEVSSHSSCPTGGGRRRLSSFSSFACLRAPLHPLLSPSCSSSSSSSSFHATSVSATAFCSSTRSRGQIGFLRCSR